MDFFSAPITKKDFFAIMLFFILSSVKIGIKMQISFKLAFKNMLITVIGSHTYCKFCAAHYQLEHAVPMT